MPPLSTHFHFAVLMVPSLTVSKSLEAFLLGTVAPDTFERGDDQSFARHPFLDAHGAINLLRFRNALQRDLGTFTHRQRQFASGYYAHLWLDIFFSAQANAFTFTKPTQLPENELQTALRAETETFNPPFVLTFARHLPANARPLALPPGMGFVDSERCLLLAHQVITQAQAAERQRTPIKLLDQAEFGKFLEPAADQFLPRRIDRWIQG